MLLRSINLRARLVGAFMLVCIFFIGFIIFNYTQINTLGSIQNTGFQRSQDALTAKETEADAVELYQAIADTELNLDFQASATKWSQVKKMTEDDLATLNKNLDTPEEKQRILEARDAYQTIVKAYEDQMLPALKKANASTADTLKMDGDMDVLIQNMHTPLIKILSVQLKTSPLEILTRNWIPDHRMKLGFSQKPSARWWFICKRLPMQRRK